MNLSEYFNATSLIKDGNFSILDAVDGLETNTLTFCQDLYHLRIADLNNNISCIITEASLVDRIRNHKGIVVLENPRLIFFKLYNEFTRMGLNRPQMDFGMGTHCRIHPTAVISERTLIGDDVEISPHAIVTDYSLIGNGSYIGPGVVVGAEGLLTIENNGEPLIVRHAGGVDIGEKVVVLSNAVIAKSLYRSFTKIGNYSQVGILTNIGHGVRMGSRCIISGNCIIAGRVQLGENVLLGASSSIAQGIKIGDNAQTKLGSVVIKNVKENEIVSGNFAFPHAQNLRNYLSRRQK